MTENPKARRTIMVLLGACVLGVISALLLLRILEMNATERAFQATASVIAATNFNVGISGPSISTAKPWTPTPTIQLSTEDSR